MSQCFSNVRLFTWGRRSHENGSKHSQTDTRIGYRGSPFSEEIMVEEDSSDSGSDFGIEACTETPSHSAPAEQPSKSKSEPRCTKVEPLRQQRAFTPTDPRISDLRLSFDAKVEVAWQIWLTDILPALLALPVSKVDAVATIASRIVLSYEAGIGRVKQPPATLWDMLNSCRILEAAADNTKSDLDWEALTAMFAESSRSKKSNLADFHMQLTLVKQWKTRVGHLMDLVTGDGQAIIATGNRACRAIESARSLSDKCKRLECAFDHISIMRAKFQRTGIAHFIEVAAQRGIDAVSLAYVFETGAEQIRPDLSDDDLVMLDPLFKKAAGLWAGASTVTSTSTALSSEVRLRGDTTKWKAVVADLKALMGSVPENLSTERLAAFRDLVTRCNGVAPSETEKQLCMESLQVFFEGVDDVFHALRPLCCPLTQLIEPIGAGEGMFSRFEFHRLSEGAKDTIAEYIASCPDAGKRAVLDDDLRIAKRVVHDKLTLTDLATLAWEENTAPIEVTEILETIISTAREMEQQHCDPLKDRLETLLVATKEWAPGGVGGFVWHHDLDADAPYDDVWQHSATTLCKRAHNVYSDSRKEILRLEVEYGAVIAVFKKSIDADMQTSIHEICTRLALSTIEGIACALFSETCAKAEYQTKAGAIKKQAKKLMVTVPMLYKQIQTRLGLAQKGVIPT